MIKIFADCADLNQMQALLQYLCVAGFTTNPAMARAAGVARYRAFAQRALGIARPRPVSIAVLSEDSEEMLREARGLAAVGDNVFVKVPIVSSTGRSHAPVIRELALEGVRLNVTAVFTSRQALGVGSAGVRRCPRGEGGVRDHYSVGRSDPPQDGRGAVGRRSRGAQPPHGGAVRQRRPGLGVRVVTTDHRREIDCPECAGMKCELCSASLGQVAKNGDRCMNTMPPGPRCRKAKAASALIRACDTCGGTGRVVRVVSFEPLEDLRALRSSRV